MSVRFNAPPGWPIPLPSWAPGDDWMPDPSWPAPPHGWTFWVVVDEQRGRARSRRARRQRLRHRPRELARGPARPGLGRRARGRSVRRRPRAACAPSRAGQLLAAGRAAGTRPGWTSEVDVLLRVAPEVRLSSSASGLRATLEGERSRPDTGVGSRLASNRSAPTADEHPTLTELEARARQAQKSDDLPALWSVEETLRSLHLENHPLRRRPEPPEAGGLPAKERALLERKRVRGGPAAGVGVQAGGAQPRHGPTAETEADSFSRALDLAQVVIAQHRAAVARRPVERPRRARPLRRHRRARRRVRRRRMRLHVHRRRVGRRDARGATSPS